MPENGKIEDSLEFSELMENYRAGFNLVAKGIIIYLFIIGACLSLPHTLKFEDQQSLILFKEMCGVFAIVVTVAGLAGYLVGAVSFWQMHMRIKNLAKELEMLPPNTWMMPYVMGLACGVAVILAFMVAKYA